MHLIRTDKSGFGMLLAGASIFIFLCTVPGMLAAGSRASMDGLVLSCLLGGVIFVGLFFGGHLLLRRAGAGGRAWYAALGALCLVLAYAARMEINSFIAVVRQGLFAYFFFLPTIVGAAFGFLYAKVAGWDRDDPAELEAALETLAAETGPAPALVRTGTETWFEGPLRVRTSFPLMLLSSLIGGGVLFICRALMLLAVEARALGDPDPAAILDHSMQMSLYVGAEMIFLTLAGIIPISLCVIAGHFVARAMKTKAGWAYFLIGFFAPIAIAVLSVGLLTMVAIMIALPTAVSMALYRSFAGLEPAPVAEDIIVADPRSLVGADHPRRRYGRVIAPRQ